MESKLVLSRNQVLARAFEPRELQVGEYYVKIFTVPVLRADHRHVIRLIVCDSTQFKKKQGVSITYTKENGEEASEETNWEGLIEFPVPQRKEGAKLSDAHYHLLLTF